MKIKILIYIYLMEQIDYDLEDKINLIYEFLYNNNSKSCFNYDKITLGKINLDDIKIKLPDENPDEIEYYNKIKSDILNQNSRLKIISFDEKSNTILFKRYSNQFPINIKVQFYKDDKINLMENHINNDSLFSYLLSQIVLSKKSKHILLPIINFDINYSDIDNYLVEDPSQQIIKKAILNKDISNICCLQLREHFFKTITLDDFLRENKCSYKGLLFQVIHTLAVLQNEYNGFRHNNLTLDNILVYLKKESDNVTEYSGFKNDKFYLPNVGFDIKITNFEKAIIPKFYGIFNSKNVLYGDQINPYFDLYIFLNQLMDKYSKCDDETTQTKSEFLNQKTTSFDETLKFLNKIYPPHIRGIKNYNKNMIIATPIELLYDNYFSDYLKKPDKEIVDSFINHQYYTGKIDTFIDSDKNSVLGNQHKLISKYSIMSKHNSRTIKKEESDLTESDTSYKSNKRIIRKDKNLSGGSIEALPYKAERNTPFISNDQRDTFKKKSLENPVREPPVILEQKIYDTSQKPPPKPQFPPTFIPIHDENGKIMNNLLPYSNTLNQPPIQKVYNINLSSSVHGFSTINKIYEDVLPGDQFNFTSLTIYERQQIIHYLRNNIIESVDGEELNSLGSKKSLLEFIKILNVNPYTVNKNPYIDLPLNFLIYRAAYPVRYDEKINSIMIAKSSMGVNIRIYMLSLGALRCKTLNNNINADNFDVWRDLMYYDWTKKILNKKVSPNFITPILYKIDSKSKIDWNNLLMIKKQKVLTLKSILDNQDKINEKHEIEKNTLFNQFIPKRFLQNTNLQVTDPVKLPKNKEDLTSNSGSTLVLLTEAPTSSLLQWSSTIYESFGSIKKMIASGYHTPDVWESILFQLIYSCAILQLQNIYITNFGIKNIFIKDIFSDSASTGSWIYKVDDVEYFIPNYGYILMIDSNYSDIEPVFDYTGKRVDKGVEYKIYSKDLYKENSFMSGDNSVLIFNQIRDMINPDNFGHNFRVNGGSSPSEEIIDLLRNMYNDTTISKVKDYIPKYFKKFVHNRVGTLLNKSEKENINLLSKPEFNKGKLIVYQKRYQEYVWVVDLGSDTQDGLKRKILLKDDQQNYIDTEVFKSTLYSYPATEKIQPENTKHLKYDESHIYETYSLSNL
jgi:hypothetical protein